METRSSVGGGPQRLQPPKRKEKDRHPRLGQEKRCPEERRGANSVAGERELGGRIRAVASWWMRVALIGCRVPDTILVLEMLALAMREAEGMMSS